MADARTQRLVLLIAILASFVAFLDGTVVNVALPAMQRELGGGMVTQQWVVDAYFITLGSLILVAGSLSDVFGRIVIMRVGLVIFGAASVAIFLAPDPLFLVICRAIQGVGGAFLVPSSLALITTYFRGPAQARAIGIWTAATTAALLVGPVMGGLFVDFLTWRLVFLINVVPIAVTLWLLAILRERDVRKPGSRVDWGGAALCTIGLGGTVYAFIEQGNLGWSSPAIWGSMTIGILALIGFIVRQATAKQPMMPLELYRVRNFSAGNITTLFVYGALALNGLVVTVYLQQGAHLSATLAGLTTIPVTIIMISLSSLIGGLSGRWGPRMFMTIGPALMAVGFALLLTVSENFDYWTQVLPSTILTGLGLVITVAPLTSAILGSIDPARSGIASAVNNAVARIAGLICIALLGVITSGVLDLAGFHRVAVFTAVLMAAGAVTSFIGIRNPVHAAAGQASPNGEQPAAGKASPTEQPAAERPATGGSVPES
ncbi:MFS transporter [Microbacterium rhizosphaerae]|uniref:MFS transporter n=3 Tax=Actinomycetes TaxID=1760 RepID=A0ABZ0SMW1_9MICO|nr:MFS transporter [Microbacterium rhizosphaerae]WPR89601.1 MFS transporter [Microbacterium rhizosphaerae]